MAVANTAAVHIGVRVCEVRCSPGLCPGLGAYHHLAALSAHLAPALVVLVCFDLDPLIKFLFSSVLLVAGLGLMFRCRHPVSLEVQRLELRSEKSQGSNAVCSWEDWILLVSSTDAQRFLSADPVVYGVIIRK